MEAAIHRTGDYLLQPDQDIPVDEHHLFSDFLREFGNRDRFSFGNRIHVGCRCLSCRDPCIRDGPGRRSTATNHVEINLLTQRTSHHLWKKEKIQ